MRQDPKLEHLLTQPYLRGVGFVRKSYRAFRLGWEHDHCVACWARLAEPPSADPEAVHEGYATTSAYARGENYEWVCPPCFAQFLG